MTIPVAILLGFAGWTLATLALPIGWYRWRRIFTGVAAINDFERDSVHPAGWYQRATRAHANCLENLPIYTVLVFVITVTGIAHPALDVLSLVIMGARVVQTTTHIAFVQTARVVSVRFTFFSVQLVCMIAMGVIITRG